MIVVFLACLCVRIYIFDRTLMSIIWTLLQYLITKISYLPFYLSYISPCFRHIIIIIIIIIVVIVVVLANPGVNYTRFHFWNGDISTRKFSIHRCSLRGQARHSRHATSHHDVSTAHCFRRLLLYSSLFPVKQWIYCCVQRLRKGGGNWTHRIVELCKAETDIVKAIPLSPRLAFQELTNVLWTTGRLRSGGTAEFNGVVRVRTGFSPT
jgi:hypothetical protein